MHMSSSEQRPGTKSGPRSHSHQRVSSAAGNCAAPDKAGETVRSGCHSAKGADVENKKLLRNREGHVSFRGGGFTV